MTKRINRLINQRSSKPGFTLIELLVYIAIFAVVSVVIVDLFVTVTKGYAQADTANEVQQNLRYSLSRISNAIRGATGVNSASGSTLSLAMSNAGANPTIFDLSFGVLRIQEGVNPAVALTSDRVTVDSLIFTAVNNSLPAKKSVETDITVSYNNQGNQGYAYTVRAKTAATLRQ